MYEVTHEKAPRFINPNVAFVRCIVMDYPSESALFLWFMVEFQRWALNLVEKNAEN